jgi:hypothetical protein
MQVSEDAAAASGHGQGCIKSEASNAVTKAVMAQSKEFRPVGKDHRSPVFRREHFIGSLVPVLLVSRGPVAIAWIVWSVIVSAFKGIASARPSAHISNECRKAVAPFMAHCDSASTVTMEVGSLRVIATISRFGPHLKLRFPRHAMRECSLAKSFVTRFLSAGQAFLGAHLQQLTWRHQVFIAALADAFTDVELPRWVHNAFDYSEFAESLAC